MLTATLPLTTLVTVILVTKVYQTINITLHNTVSCRTCNQGVATFAKTRSWINAKTEEKTDNVTQNAPITQHSKE